jgi:hypothetical protein
MKASELASHLRRVVEEHGDHDVAILDCHGFELLALEPDGIGFDGDEGWIVLGTSDPPRIYAFRSGNRGGQG